VLTVVTGLPGAGKAAYVAEHKDPGDIVIDFDLIAEAIGSPVPHDHSPEITQVARCMRGTGIRAALHWAARGKQVWIIDCEPPLIRQLQYLGAACRVVRLNPPPGGRRRRLAGRRAS
jgi:predicted kinase